MTDALASMVQALSGLPAVQAEAPRAGPGRPHRNPPVDPRMAARVLALRAQGVTWTRVTELCGISRVAVQNIVRADRGQPPYDLCHLGEAAMQRYRVVSDVAYGLLKGGPMTQSRLAEQTVFAAAARKEGLCVTPTGRVRPMRIVARAALRSLRQQGRVRLQGHKWVAL